MIIPLVLTLLKYSIIVWADSCLIACEAAGIRGRQFVLRTCKKSPNAIIERYVLFSNSGHQHMSFSVGLRKLEIKSNTAS